jgi:hypothetical protein
VLAKVIGDIVFIVPPFRLKGLLKLVELLISIVPPVEERGGANVEAEANIKFPDDTKIDEVLPKPMGIFEVTVAPETIMLPAPVSVEGVLKVKLPPENCQLPPLEIVALPLKVPPPFSKSIPALIVRSEGLDTFNTELIMLVEELDFTSCVPLPFKLIVPPTDNVPLELNVANAPFAMEITAEALMAIFPLSQLKVVLIANGLPMETAPLMVNEPGDENVASPAPLSVPAFIVNEPLTDIVPAPAIVPDWIIVVEAKLKF